MDRDGLGRKLAIAAAGMGAVLLVLRVVGGRNGGSVDEETNDDGDEIDRVDTGRSDEDRSDSSVETGLERVSTDDEDGTSSEAEESSESEWETDIDETDATGKTDAIGETDVEDEADDASGASGEDEDEDDSDGRVPVKATGGRFADLDLFDYVAIAGAAFEAAREEYRNRT